MKFKTNQCNECRISVSCVLKFPQKYFWIQFFNAKTDRCNQMIKWMRTCVLMKEKLIFVFIYLWLCRNVERKLWKFIIISLQTNIISILKKNKNKSGLGKFHENLSHSFLAFTNIDKQAIYIGLAQKIILFLSLDNIKSISF